MSTPSSSAPANQISMKDLHGKTQAGLPSDSLVLDVRSAEEYAEGHVPGSRNIPYEDVQKFSDDLKKYGCIYIHCQSGGRAQKAYRTLEDLGLKNLVCVTGSGMADWVRARFPVER